MFNIEPDEAEHFNGRPFVKLVTAEGVTVVTAHDLFEFKPGDAERLAACWNCLSGLSNETVARLAAYLEQHNNDTVAEMLREEGF